MQVMSFTPTFRVSALALALAAVASPGLAQVSAEPLLIHSLDVRGNNPLSAADTSAVMAPYLRTPATLESLAAITAALEAALQAQGYSLYKVTLPPQTLGSDLRLDVLRFDLSQIELRGNQHIDRDNALASLPELVPGQSPNLLRLALQTRLANTSAHKQLRVGLSESKTPDSVDAAIAVEDHSPWLFGVDVNNTGSDATGKDRITFQVAHSNLFNRDHALSAVWTTSAERSDDVKQWGLSYRVPLYELGGALSASLSQSNVVGNFGAFSSTGAGRTTQVGYMQLIPAAGNWTGEWSLMFNDRLFNGAQLRDASGSAIAGTTTPDTRTRSLSLGHSGMLEGDSVALSYSLSWAQALNGGRGNNLAAYTNGGTNPAIKTTDWYALRASANLQAPLPAKWLLTWRGEAQYTADALLPGEQFGLGGSTSVRGMAERTLQGDTGLLSTLEVRSPELSPGLNAIGFVDLGLLGNNNPNPTNRLDNDHVASAGVGLRWASPAGLSLTLDYGRIIWGSRLPVATSPGAPRVGDDRLHLNAALRF